MRFLLPYCGIVLATLVTSCTAGVAHTVTVVLPTPHLAASGKARQFGTLYFYTDRNMPDTSTALKALLSGQTTQALEALGRIEGANLPSVQRAYWLNDVAVCFILEGRYKEADELLLQAGLAADEDAIRHNHRVSVYLNGSHHRQKASPRPVVVPEGGSPDSRPATPVTVAPGEDKK